MKTYSSHRGAMHKHHIIKISRFAISGGLSALLQISLLHFLMTAGIHYLFASAVGVIAGMTLNFFLQKLWSFKETTMTARIATQQYILFAINGCINLALNTGLMHFFVDTLSIIPLIAQCLSIGLLALYNFFVYGKIFRPKLF